MTPTSPNQASSTPVASADAAMFTALLPNSSAPIILSRALSRRFTIAAPRFPCFSRRCMLAREEAVNAVSLPAKKAESRIQIRTATRANQSWPAFAREFLDQKGVDLGGIDVGRDEAFADSARQDERQLASLDLFVLGDEFHQAVGVGQN